MSDDEQDEQQDEEDEEEKKDDAGGARKKAKLNGAKDNKRPPPPRGTNPAPRIRNWPRVAADNTKNPATRAMAHQILLNNNFHAMLHDAVINESHMAAKTIHFQLQQLDLQLQGLSIGIESLERKLNVLKG